MLDVDEGDVAAPRSQQYRLDPQTNDQPHADFRPVPDNRIMRIFKERGITTDKYKFTVCNHWAAGQCEFSRTNNPGQCVYAHGLHDELRPEGEAVDRAFMRQLNKIRRDMGADADQVPADVRQWRLV